MRKDLVLSACFAAAAVGLAFPANAEYPERAVTVIVTSSPLAGTDWRNR